MRIRVGLLSVIVFLTIYNTAFSQTDQRWPDKTADFTIYGSTLALSSLLLGSFEYYWHKGIFHPGITSGVSLTFGEYSIGHGGHTAFSMLIGNNNHLFEAKLGISIHPDRWYDYTEEREMLDFYKVPVITAGYRYQKPQGRWFFRTALSTAGIGVGVGYVFFKSK